MDASDLCLPHFPTLGWFVCFGENGFTGVDFCNQVDVFLKLVFSWKVLSMSMTVGEHK